MLKDKVVVLGVTGGIAAYKAVELLRLLVKAGADVHVIMTRAASEFVTPLTFQTLSGNPVHSELFNLLTEQEIGPFCEQNLPRYKRPRRIIFGQVPRGSTGKIEKPKLREKYGKGN